MNSVALCNLESRTGIQYGCHGQTGTYVLLIQPLTERCHVVLWLRDPQVDSNFVGPLSIIVGSGCVEVCTTSDAVRTKYHDVMFIVCLE